MVEIKCPDCGNLMEGEHGATAICSNCGFSAVVPPMAAEEAAAPAEREGRPDAPQTVPALTSMSVWAYLLSALAVGTFFLAAFWLPFVLAAAGLGLGLAAFLKDRDDRRSVVSLGLSAFALLAGAVYLLA